MFMMALCAGLGVALSGCSDKDDEPVVPAAKLPEGTYKGDMTCRVMDVTLEYEGLMVAITATDDATVTVAIPSFGGQGHNTLAAFDVPAVKVSGRDDVYSLAPTEFGGTNSAGQTYSGSLQGSLAGGTLTLEFSLNIGAMPMPMNCVFTSTGN